MKERELGIEGSHLTDAPFFLFALEGRRKVDTALTYYADAITITKRAGVRKFVPDTRGDGFEMLNLADFASRMGVCKNTIRNWIREGKLVRGVHYFQAGRIYRFPWGPEFVKELMCSLVPIPALPRPKLKSRGGNRGQVVYRA